MTEFYLLMNQKPDDDYNPNQVRSSVLKLSTRGDNDVRNRDFNASVRNISIYLVGKSGRVL